MNIVVNSKLFHKRLRLLGNKELRLNSLTIPCEKCNALFKSYAHYGTSNGYTYDSTCEVCGSIRSRLGGHQ